MGIGWPQLLVIAVIVLILFGRGRISEMMGDFGKGINSFKKGLNEETSSSSSSSSENSPQIQAPTPSETPSATTESSESANAGDKSAS